MIPECHLQAIELLPNLEHLHLLVPSDGTWSESTLDPLKYMKALTSLSLNIREIRGPLLLSPSLAQLTQLEDLNLESQNAFYDETSQAQFMQTVGKLTRLETLGLENMVESIPAELERLSCLTYLELSGLDFDDPHFAISPSFGMCTKLRHVCLSWFLHAINKAWLLLCRSLLLLPQLDTLDIRKVDLSGVQPSSWVLPLRLTELNLMGCRMSMFPAALCCLPHLAHLIVRDADQGMQLASLPRGPYLHNLQRLDINRPDSGAKPEALRDAVHLENLLIQSKQYPGPFWTESALQQLIPTGCTIFLHDYRVGSAGEDCNEGVHA